MLAHFWKPGQLCAKEAGATLGPATQGTKFSKRTEKKKKPQGSRDNRDSIAARLEGLGSHKDPTRGWRPRERRSA